MKHTHLNRFGALLLIVSLLFSVHLMPVSATDLLPEPTGAGVTGEWSGIPDFIPEPASADEISMFAADAPAVYCRAAYLMAMDTGEVLYAYNADAANYPASTTKIMTAYLCLKYGNVNDYFTVSHSSRFDLTGASLAGLAVGERLSVYGLLQALLTVSGCDAANVIGEYISGSCGAFVDLMNQEAAALGCTNTHFVNCHGVPTPYHYTTVHDIALIANAAMQYPVFREIVGSAQVTLEATNLRGARVLKNTNGLLPGSGSDYSYPYAIGIKTGSSSASGYCLVSAAEKDGVRLMCVIYGAPSSSSRNAQSVNLLNWGFENYNPNTIARGSITLSQSSYVYHGTPCKPSVSVVLDGTTLVPGQDYTVSYTGENTIGTAAVTVTGCGSYIGSQTLYYTIANPLPFEDVPLDYWAYPYILSAYRDKLVKGTSETTFTPLDGIRRADAVLMLYRYYGEPEVTMACSLEDVSKDDYYYKAMCWAEENGIIKDLVNGNLFRPTEAITRQDMTVLIYCGEKATPVELSLGVFSDAAEISDYAQPAMEWAVSAGMIKGRVDLEENILLDPQGITSRAELATILVRYKAEHEQEEAA